MQAHDSPAARQTALLVIDVQLALFQRATPIHDADRLLQHITTLVERAHDRRVPVYFFRHANKGFLTPGSAGWQLHPALKPAASDTVLDKRHGSAFKATALHEALQARGIDRLIVTGLVTNGCIQATCNDALERGYTLVVVEDGHSSYRKDAAQLVATWNQRMIARGVAVLPANQIIW